MKLYYMPGACSLAPHIVLREAGLPFDLEQVDRSKKTKSGEDYLAINSKGAVPAIRLDNGQVLTEGAVIQQYIADQVPAKKLAPAAGTLERYRLQEWLNYIGSEVHKGIGQLFNPAMPEEGKQIFRDRLASRFGFIDRELEGKDYLMGEHFTVADAYLYVVTRWAKPMGIDISGWPNLAKHHQRVAARPAVREALDAEGLK